MTPWIPEVPTFRRTDGKDGKVRLYLAASNEMDIEVMLTAAGLPHEGIRQQQDHALTGWYRIIKMHEEKRIRDVFPL